MKSNMKSNMKSFSVGDIVYYSVGVKLFKGQVVSIIPDFNSSEVYAGINQVEISRVSGEDFVYYEYLKYTTGWHDSRRVFKKRADAKKYLINELREYIQDYKENIKAHNKAIKELEAE